MTGKMENCSRPTSKRVLAVGVCLLLMTVFVSVNGKKYSKSDENDESSVDEDINTICGDKSSLSSSDDDNNDDSCDMSGNPPHIVVVLIDDAGWNDVGWNNDFIPTPNLNELAHDGVILDNMYSQPMCTPSRVALLTGRYPSKVGMQHGSVRPMQPYYLPRQYATLADKLKEVGYMNHIVGKWHIGSCNWTYTPLWRGFDSHYGCSEGATSSHETHVLNIPIFGTPIVSGIDLRDNTGVVTHQNGTHNVFLFSERAEKIVRNHNPKSPLFLYVAYMAPHFPLDVPKGFEDSVELADDDRRKFAGMMAALDDGVGNITRALKDNNMWEDTLFVFLSDNGGDAAFAGSNYPFRGNKATLWEGGVKVPAFIHGSMLKQSGYVNKELYHFTDVFATLLKVAGGEPDDDIDGKNQWDSLCRGEHSERSEMLLHLDTHPVTNGAALRSGDYKYIEGITNLVVQKLNQNDELHFDQWYRPADSPDAEIPDAPLISENVNNRFLFNLKDDPLETTNLFNDPDKQDIINEMKQRLDEYRASLPQFWFPPGFDERGNPDNFGEAWTPGWC